MNAQITVRKPRQDEAGMVLVVVAIVLVILLGFVALGVDTGILYSARASAKNAADAAALAGAYTFISTPTSPQPATAEAAARAVAKQYAIFGTPVVDADIDVYPDAATKAADIAAHRVPVVVRAVRQTYFAKALGIMNANIRVDSLAEAGPHISGACGPVEADGLQHHCGPAVPKPFFMPNTITSGMAPCAACTAGQYMVDPANGNVTAYGLSQLGAQVVVKPQKPGGALMPSIYYLIDFDGGGGGAKQLRDWIDGTDPVPPVACGNILPLEKGNKVSIKHGVDTLLGNPPDDIYQAPGQYHINGGALSDQSKALVEVPIWDTCNWDQCKPGGTPISNGHPTIKVLGFATVFLEGITTVAGGDEALRGRIVNIGGCGPPVGGAAPVTGSVVTGGFPLRLVRP